MDFQPGQVIQDYEEPFVTHLNIEYKALRCSNCFKFHGRERNKFIICRHCEVFTYCNDRCKRLDIAHNRVECAAYVDGTIVNDDATAQIVRLAALLKINGSIGSKLSQHYNGDYRCFNDLPIRVVDDDATNETSMAIRELSRRLVQCGALTESECNFERMLKLYRTWQTHGFLLYNEGRSEYIGGAIYVLCSIYQHSCRPNAIRVVDESFRMQIRCISAINKDETPTITYLANIRNRADRHRKLQEDYGFDCKCTLCEEEKEADRVDYRELGKFKRAFDMEAMCTANQLIRVEQIIGEMKKLFSNYDERITNMYMDALLKIVKTPTELIGNEVRSTVLPRFFQQAKDNMRVTFGSTHREYQHFTEEIVAKLNLPADNDA